MSLNLATAVYTRWNNASLDNTVSTVYWGETAPEGDDLPRAVYEIASDDNSGLSRGSLMHTVRLRFKTWNASPELVSGYNRLIFNAFHNAHNAGTNPLTMSGGTVQHCLYQSETTEEEDTEVYMGIVDFEVKYEEQNTTPG